MKTLRPQIHMRCLFRGGAEMSPSGLAHALDDHTTGHLEGLPGTVGHFWFWAQFSDEKGNLAGSVPKHSPAHFLGPAPATEEPRARDEL